MLWTTPGLSRNHCYVHQIKNELLNGERAVIENGARKVQTDNKLIDCKDVCHIFLPMTGECALFTAQKKLKPKGKTFNAT
jgi:hypothetical protein